MIRVRIGALLLAALLAAGVWSQQRMEQLHMPIARELRAAAEQLLHGDPAQAALGITRAEAAWHRARPFTSALADHQPLEDIESLLAQLPAADTPQARAALCAEAARKIEAVPEAHRLTLHNFF